jgi:hypothetical protein
MLKEEAAREEAKERARNNGQLSAATKAAKEQAERSEAALRQMQSYSQQANGAGTWQRGPSGPYLGIASSGGLGFDLPKQVCTGFLL